MSQAKQFIDMMKPYVIKDWKKKRILPSLTIAQGALESGWGKHAPNNNYFGIKSHGQSNGQMVTTKEFVGGKWITINASFRTYSTPEGSIQDHSDFLIQYRRYAKVVGEKDYKVACKEIQAAGYATDPNYANLLIGIIESNQIFLIDKEAFALENQVNLAQATIDVILKTWIQPAYGKAADKAGKDAAAALGAALRAANKDALDKTVANKIINDYISPAWKASKDQKQKDYIHHLADELRKASGQ